MAVKKSQEQDLFGNVATQHSSMREGDVAIGARSTKQDPKEAFASLPYFISVLHKKQITFDSDINKFIPVVSTIKIVPGVNGAKEDVTDTSLVLANLKNGLRQDVGLQVVDDDVLLELGINSYWRSEKRHIDTNGNVTIGYYPWWTTLSESKTSNINVTVGSGALVNNVNHHFSKIMDKKRYLQFLAAVKKRHMNDKLPYEAAKALIADQEKSLKSLRATADKRGSSLMPAKIQLKEELIKEMQEALLIQFKDQVEAEKAALESQSVVNDKSLADLF